MCRGVKNAVLMAAEVPKMGTLLATVSARSGHFFWICQHGVFNAAARRPINSNSRPR